MFNSLSFPSLLIIQAVRIHKIFYLISSNDDTHLINKLLAISIIYIYCLKLPNEWLLKPKDRASMWTLSRSETPQTCKTMLRKMTDSLRLVYLTWSHSHANWKLIERTKNAFFAPSITDTTVNRDTPSSFWTFRETKDKKGLLNMGSISSSYQK